MYKISCIFENSILPSLTPNCLNTFDIRETKKGSVSEKAICKSSAIATVFTAFLQVWFAWP